ncbi:hypothetical protein CHUAL_001209 [Chamberlinius hualienensis]
MTSAKIFTVLLLNFGFAVCELAAEPAPEPEPWCRPGIPYPNPIFPPYPRPLPPFPRPRPGFPFHRG